MSTNDRLSTMSKNPKYDTSSSRDVPGLYSSRQISKTTGTSSCLEYTSREGNSRPQSSRSAKHEVKEEGDEQAEEVTKATDAYAALCAVGMPEEVTREAFIRLYLSSDRTSLSGGKGKEREKETDHLHRKEKGKRRQVAAHEKDATGGVPWKALIDTLAAQLVGRSEVTRVRSILQASEGEGPHKDLSDRLASAHRILNATRREWEVERANLDALDRQLHSLRAQVAERRRVLLLLGVLEKQESARLARLGSDASNSGRRGLGNLIKELRQESVLGIQEVGSMLVEISKGDTAHMRAQSPRKTHIVAGGAYRHTRDALARFHALNIRLHAAYEDVKEEPTTPTQAELDERLSSVLDRLGVAEVELPRMRTNLEALARLRASRHLQFPSISSNYTPEELEISLNTRLDALQTTRRAVESKVARVVGLGWVAEGCVDALATFRAETAPALRTLLGEEAKMVEGHVDLLRKAIISCSNSDSLPKGQRPDEDFARNVRSTLGTTRVGVCDEVVELLHDASMREEACRGLMVGGGFGIEDEGGTEVRVGDERNAKLLERKARKAEHGFVIASEVKGLMDGLRRLREVSK